MKRGDCYGKAARRLLNRKNAEGWHLVHGFAFVGGMIPGAHAWLRLPDGRVWDPTENGYGSEQEYAANWHATPFREYTQQEAAQLMAEHGHYGPWYDEQAGWQAEDQFKRQHVPGYAECVAAFVAEYEKKG